MSSARAHARRPEDEEERTGEPREAQPAPIPPVAKGAVGATLSRSQVLALQRSAGNVAVSSMLSKRIQREDGPGTGTAPPGVEGEGHEAESEPETAPETTKKEPEHPPPPKLKMDLASGEAVLTQSFGAVKKIVPGTIQVLDQAAFQAAYDNIYGATKWSWAKHVATGPGNLNGFAYQNVNYINKNIAGLHTVVHEMLHNNAHATWTPFVGPEWNEGTTEVLTQEACAKVSEPAPTCYPGESPVIREAMASGLPLADIIDAYFNGGAAFKIAAWINTNCKANWATVKAAMTAKNWNAAKAALAKK